MKSTIRTLETLSDMLDNRRDKLTNLPDDTLFLIRGTLDSVIDHLKSELPREAKSNPFDMDEEESRKRGVISQVETLTDAMQKLKKRFDKAVVKQDYTQELDHIVHSMCMISERTTELAEQLL